MKNSKVKTEEAKSEVKVIDAAGRTLGRVASEVAQLLLGKNKTSFERNKFSGSKVQVINASKIKSTSKKLENLSHARYSGYPGGLKVESATETISKKGWGELLKLSVNRMLPKNKLHKEMMKNLKVEE